MKNYLIALIVFTALSNSCKKHTAIYDFTTNCKRTAYSSHPNPIHPSEFLPDSIITPEFTIEHHTEKSFDEIEAKQYIVSHTKVSLNGLNCTEIKVWPGTEMWNKIGTDSFTCIYVVHY